MQEHMPRISSPLQKTIALIRILTAIIFILFGQYKLFTPAFAHGGFEQYVSGFVHPANDYGNGWRVHHYGMEGHRADAAADVEHYESVRDADDVTRMPSGELVATLLDGMITGKARSLPVNVVDTWSYRTPPWSVSRLWVH